jgi:hypothetical protein
VNSVVKLLQGPHRIGIFCLLLVIIFLLPVAYCEARFVEGVVAFVDDAAITWGELNENYERVKKTKAVTVKEEVLNTMINRLLLLSEAKRLKIEAKTEEDIRNEYIDLKIRSVVRISEGDMEDFYNKNLSEFKDETFEAVRGRIEDYLTELEINKKLKKHIEELRAKAYVKIIRE